MVQIASEDVEQASKDAALRGLLDNYERAVLHKFEMDGVPDNDWDEETQADIDRAKVEAANRLLRLRTRLFRIASAGQVEGILLTPRQIGALTDDARGDEIRRAADWMLTCADKALERGGSADWEEAQFLFRYASLLRDLTPFPYRPRPEGSPMILPLPPEGD